MFAREAAKVEAAGETHIPLPLEGLQVPKSLGYGLVTQDGFVLLEEAVADFSVLGFRDGVFCIRLFEAIEGDNDAVDLREGIIEIALGGCSSEFNLLRMRYQVSVII